MIPIVWLSLNPDTPPRGYWDMGMLEDVFSNKMWRTPYEFVHYEDWNKYLASWQSAPHKDSSNNGAVIIFPARAQVDYIKELNEKISELKWVVLFLTGDEEATFPVEKIKHKNIKIWVMSPRGGRHDKYGKLGTGYPPQAREWLPKYEKEATLRRSDFFFAGQITHERRQQLAEQLTRMKEDGKIGVFTPTKGFTQGDPHDLYYKQMSDAKVAPAPSGPETPDSFRLFEALESGCVPIADTRVPKNNFSDNYWTYFFNEEPPFPVLTEYDQLPGYIEDAVSQYPVLNNKIFSWWIRKKREFVRQIVSDITEVSGITCDPTISDLITVIIPTSPIKSHPDVSTIDETIKSIRHHLPTAEIILTFDGVRPEQEDRRVDYNEFIKRMLWKCNNEYKNIVPLIFEEHSHQSGMARKALEYVKTPILLYVEQDTPLVIDYEIPFLDLSQQILEGKSNMIRFHFEAVIPKDHYHMVHGMEPDIEVPLLRTSQWSQRPHLASVAFYKRILSENFSSKSKSFIEDLMHGVLDQAYRLDGINGWHQYKIHIYAPEGNFKRSYHSDGRQGEPKWDNSQIW